MDFAQVDRRFQDLKQEHEAGNLTTEAFEEALRELMVQDDQGRWWAKGARTGGWHYYDAENERWIDGVPPVSPAAGSEVHEVKIPLRESLRHTGAHALVRSAATRSRATLNTVWRASGTIVSRRPWRVAAIALALVAALALAAYLLPFDSAPRVTSDGMIKVPAGSYIIGSGRGGRDYVAQRTVPVAAFWIDKWEVTNVEYERFVRERDVEPPAYWLGGVPPWTLTDHPVRGVRWDEATAYCDWLGKRLPTEIEWEAAARGTDGRLYTWGDEESRVLTLSAAGTAPKVPTHPVGTFLPDHSPTGLFDVAFNLHEWVGEPYEAVAEGQRVLRGGSPAWLVNLATRIVGDPADMTTVDMAGFRCAADVDRVEEVGSSDRVLRDEFGDQTSGWAIGADQNPGYHVPDWYHLEAAVDGPEVLIATKEHELLSDLSMTAEMFVSQPNTDEDGEFRYGLVARKTGDDAYYAFVVIPKTRRWQVLRHTPAGLEVLGQGTDQIIDGVTGRDVLRLDVSDSTFAFAIDGRLVHYFADPAAPAAGEIGFYVETLDASRVHVHVEYVDVTSLAPDVIAGPSVGQPLAAAPTATPTPVEPVAVEGVMTQAMATDEGMNGGADAGDATPTEPPVPTPFSTDVPPGPTAAASAITPTPELTPEVPLPSASGMVLVNIHTYSATVPISAGMPGFWIDQHEVTNAQYAVFLQATGAQVPDYWFGQNIPSVMGNHPVENVSWQQAADYCAWLDKRLPTQAEWQIAARGPHGWKYPWGNDALGVALPTRSTYPVGSILANRSFFGAYDMAGNVGEWVTGPYLPGRYIGSDQRVIQGGAYSYPNDLVTPLVGSASSTTLRIGAGIRCAARQVRMDLDLDPELAFATEAVTMVPSYVDDFRNTEPEWPQVKLQNEAYFYGYHPADSYHVEVDGFADCLTVPRDLETTPANLMVEANVFVFEPLTDGEGNFEYGLIARQSDRRSFYAFLISARTQEWKVIKSTPRGMAVMDSGSSSTIRGSALATRDRLLVMADGPRLSLFINGELVSDLTDTTYKDGSAGFIVQTLVDEVTAHVHNDDFAIWAIPSGAVSLNTQAPPAGEYQFDRPVCRGYFQDAELLLNFTSHTVLPGETLIEIAANYDTTVRAIMDANDIKDANRIRSGWSLVIPLQPEEE